MVKLPTSIPVERGGIDLPGFHCYPCGALLLLLLFFFKLFIVFYLFIYYIYWGETVWGCETETELQRQIRAELRTLGVTLVTLKPA